MKFPVFPEDVVEVVQRLEADTRVETWTIAKITNPQHALEPFGIGISVTVVSADGVQGWGKGRTPQDACEQALRMLATRYSRPERS